MPSVRQLYFPVILEQGALRTAVIEARRPPSTPRQDWIDLIDLFDGEPHASAVYQPWWERRAVRPWGSPAEEVIECNPTGPLKSMTRNGAARVLFPSFYH